MTDRQRVRLGVVLVAVYSVAAATRLAPLLWSPLPATLDGFRYAALAERLLATGALPLGVLEADELVFTAGLAVGSYVTGLAPLRLAQPFAALGGAVAPVVGAVLAAHLARERGWPGRRVVHVAALAGFGLAIEGLFLRRTGIPDEEAFGLVLVPILVLSAYRWLSGGQHGWAVVTGLVLLVLPPLHNLSSLIGVLSISALAAVVAVRAPDRPTLLRSEALGLGGWVVFVGYFETATRLGIELTYSGLVRPYIGLFVAWGLCLLVGSIWLQQTTPREQRLAVFLPIAGFFAIVALNALRPVFPGTVPSPPLVLGLILLLAIPVGFAAAGLPVIRTGTGRAAVAALIAPLVFTYYALSAELTAPFFDAVLRVQSFAHLPAFALAGIGVVAGVRRCQRLAVPWRRVAVAAVVLVFAGSVVATLPLGYLNLDTGSAPSTTFSSEFAATAFATEHLQGTFATDHSLSRVVTHYHTPLEPRQRTPTGGRGAYTPTRRWLTGGPLPACPLLSQRSWTTTGAHLYPTAPQRIDPAVYQRTLAERSVIYAAGGHDPVTLSLAGPDAVAC